MQTRSTKLNNERLNGNRLFLHTFKNFSTTSVKTSLKIHIVHSLVFICGMLLISYVMVVILIIFNTINKKEDLAIMNDLNIKSAKMEKDYNNTISSLTKEYALQNGFIGTSMQNFASRKDSAISLSFLYQK